MLIIRLTDDISDDHLFSHSTIAVNNTNCSRAVDIVVICNRGLLLINNEESQVIVKNIQPSHILFTSPTLLYYM